MNSNLKEKVQKLYTLDTKGNIADYFKRHQAATESIDVASVDRVAKAMLECYENNGTIYIIGNGGSASTASHICGDFIKGVSYGLPNRFKMVCFSDNITSMMAIANDISYNDIFVEPLKNFGQPQDLLIGISGSGNSTNVVKAFEYALEEGIKTVALCGYSGGKIKAMADEVIHVDINDMEIAEDLHLAIFHAIKQAIINELKGNLNGTMGGQYDARVK